MKKKIVILGLLLCTILAGCGGKQSVVAPPLQEPIGVQPDRAAAYIGDIGLYIISQKQALKLIENKTSDFYQNVKKNIYNWL